MNNFIDKYGTRILAVLAAMNAVVGTVLLFGGELQGGISCLLVASGVGMVAYGRR